VVVDVAGTAVCLSFELIICTPATISNVAMMIRKKPETNLKN